MCHKKRATGSVSDVGITLRFLSAVPFQLAKKLQEDSHVSSRFIFLIKFLKEDGVVRDFEKYRSGNADRQFSDFSLCHYNKCELHRV